MSTTETYRHALTTAFRNWHSLAVGAVLLALNVFLVNTVKSSFVSSQLSPQDWVMLIIAGYVFIAAIYLGASPLSEDHTLSEAFPGVFDHFRSFAVGGILYALGTTLVNNPVTQLKPPDQLTGVLALIVGGALVLTAVLIGVAAAFVRPKK